MQEGSERREADHGGTGQENSRPQQAGEGGTTRFGMEDGDNTEVPATGGVTDDQAPQRSE